MARRIQGPDGVIRQFPDQATDEQIAAALGGGAEQPAPTDRAGGLDEPLQASGFGSPREVVSHLPDILSFIGGLPPGPLGIAGAALGGGVGEAGRQAFGPALGLERAEDPLQRILAEAGAQAGLQTAGLGLGSIGSRAARGLMRSALRPTGRMLEEAPGLVREAIEQRAKVGGGVPAAVARRGKAAEATARELRLATQRGVKFDTTSLLADLGPVVREARLAGDKLTIREIDRVVSRFVGAHPDRITPKRLKEIKQLAQRKSKPVIGARAKGALPSDVQQTRARVWDAIATASQRELETIPGIAQKEAATRSRIRTAQAVRRAEGLRPGLTQRAMQIGGVAAGVGGGFVNPPLASLGALALLADPRVASRLSLFLTEPAVQQALRQTPRAGGALFREE